MVEVTGVDFASRQVANDRGPVLYDFLILAVGGETNYFGMDEHRALRLRPEGVVRCRAIP